MSNADITYMVKIPPEQVDTLARAMAQAELDFDPKGNMVVTGPNPEDAVHLTGDAASDLAQDINDFLETRGWQPQVRANPGDWTVQDTHQLLELAAENLIWEGNSITQAAGIASSAEWQKLAATAPHIFDHLP